MRAIAALLILLLAMAAWGCTGRQTKPDDSAWSLTPVFDVQEATREGKLITYPIRGFEGRFGFIDSGFIAGQSNKFMWAFWGDKQELLHKQLQVTGVHRETGKRVQVLSVQLGDGSFGAAAGAPTSMSLPDPGLWRLEVRVGGKHLGNIVVEAEAPVAVSEGEGVTYPAGCDADRVVAILSDFLTAFRQGDVDGTVRFFGDKFQWYSAPGSERQVETIHSVNDLPAYFAKRIGRQEQIRLQELRITGRDHLGGVDFALELHRTADDLTWGASAIAGKGAVHCEQGTIMVWSLGA